MSHPSLSFADRDHETRIFFLKAVAVSAAAHLVLLAAFGIAGWIHSRHSMFIDEHKIIVGLHSAPPGGGHKGPQPARAIAPPPKPKPAEAAPAPKKEEPKKETPKPKPKPPEPVKKVIPKPELKKETAKKDEPKPAPKPEPKKEEPKEAPTPMLPSEKLDDIELARAMADKGKTDSSGKDSDAEWNSAMEGMEGDVRIMVYRDEVNRTLSEAWTVPVTVPRNEDIHFDVIFRVDAAGNVIDYKIIKKSGNVDMDRSVQRVLDTVKKLPPLPYAPDKGYHEIPVRFAPMDEGW